MVLQRRMPERRQFWFLLWHLLWLLLACAVLTVFTLRLSTPENKEPVMISIYWNLDNLAYE